MHKVQLEDVTEKTPPRLHQEESVYLSVLAKPCCIGFLSSALLGPTRFQFHDFIDVLSSARGFNVADKVRQLWETLPMMILLIESTHDVKITKSITQ